MRAASTAQTPIAGTCRGESAGPRASCAQRAAGVAGGGLAGRGGESAQPGGGF